MIKKAIITVLFAVAAISMSYAQNTSKTDSITQKTALIINGAWKGVVVNVIDVVYEFKVNGNKFTGSKESEGTPQDITNGVINGNKIEYDSLVRDEKTHFIGELVGNVLTVMFNFQGNDLTVVLSKIEKK